MRYQGKITDWRDEKGFGFITPNGGGRQVFVHIKSFSRRQQRPSGDELVTYELNFDQKGRPQANNVAFVGGRPPQVSKYRAGDSLLWLAVLFVSLVTTAVMIGKLPFAVLALYIVGSAIAYFFYAKDKSAARKDQTRRTPEITLHILALIGGWPGALIAQYTLRHKSNKTSFQTVFWATVFLNCSVLGWLFTPHGANVLKSILGVE